MSEKLLAPSRDASPEDAQKIENVAAMQDQRDAFAAEFADADIDTNAVIVDEQEKVLEAQRKTKLAELDKHLTDPADRLRGLKSIYGEAAAQLTPLEVEAFIADRLITTPPSEKLSSKADVEKTAEQRLEAGRPAGVPTIEEAEADLKEEGPVKLGFLKRARRLAGAPGRAVWKGYSKLMSRSEKHAKRMEGMTPEQREKYEKRANIMVYAATLAIAGAYAVTKSEQLLNLIPDMTDGGNDSDKSHSADVKPVAKANEHDVTPEELARKEYESKFIYNPDNDPINNPARQGHNFRAALDMSNPDAARADLLKGLQGSPNQLAVFMANEGLIPNDLDSITSMTEKMHADPSLMASNFDIIESRMSNGPVEFVSGNSDMPYGSWYYVDNGDGTHSLAYQSTVYDGQPILMVNGKPYGCNCGQPLDIPQGSAPVAVETPEGNGTYVRPVMLTEQPKVIPPQGGGDYVPPTTEEPPVTVPPETEEPPVTVPPETEEPPVPEIPSEEKDYSGGVDRADGIDPSQNGFVGWTPDPLEGNGTTSGNLDPITAGGGEETSYNDPTATTNTDPQVTTPEPGAGTSRTETDIAAQQQAEQAAAEQKTANEAAAALNAQMEQAGSVDKAVSDAQSQIGPDGRPLK